LPKPVPSQIGKEWDAGGTTSIEKDRVQLARMIVPCQGTDEDHNGSEGGSGNHAFRINKSEIATLQ